ncbi:hypothetical protein IW261DRAFT_132064 [Armillaria novae-zelandiae]|uniref:Uncharacterized protein n=1 Tax=Armillaria novae-zelandiae TaxID=153914 RepID=A0AA39NEI2_9AGAR|nr:hypothetical protein IW261DRAFT_132064 [Armillaria novae-zelandiae]
MISPRPGRTLKMLCLIVITFLHFQISHGFHFGTFTGAITAGIPILTLSWHRDVNDTNQIYFKIVPLQGPFTDKERPLTISTTDTTQTDGSLNVTSSGLELFVVEAITLNSTNLHEIRTDYWTRLNVRHPSM